MDSLGIIIHPSKESQKTSITASGIIISKHVNYNFQITRGKTNEIVLELDTGIINDKVLYDLLEKLQEVSNFYIEKRRMDFFDGLLNSVE